MAMAASACLVLVPGVTSVAPPRSADAAAPAGAMAVSLIGDSTMAAMEWYTGTTNDIMGIIGNTYRLTFDAESCRRLVVASCRGRFGGHPVSMLPLMQTTLRGQLGAVMVVMTGYDDASITTAIDQIMAEATSQGVERVLWLNYRTSSSYVRPVSSALRKTYAQSNAELAAAAAGRADLQILDWDGYSAAQPAWFASDGIHLTPVGRVQRGLDEPRKSSGADRCRASSAAQGAVDEVVGISGELPTGLGFVPREPARVLDTRAAVAGVAGNVGERRTMSVDVGNLVPPDAGAAVLSVTAVDSCAAGYLTVFGCGARPPTSNLNYTTGRTTAGLAITPMTLGRVCVYASSRTDVVIDVIGAFTPGGDGFHPIVPTRWVDTRSGAAQLGEIKGERGASSETTIALRGVGAVPADATAVWLNLTIADPATDTVFQAYPGPCGSPPLASNVNARAQHSMASAVLVGLGPEGSVCVRTYSGRAQIVVDVAGWFGPAAGGLRYQAVQPLRLFDGRERGGGVTTAPQPVHVADVAVLNVTVTGSTGAGYVAVEPCSSNNISSLINTVPNEATANVIAVNGDAAGTVCAAASVPSYLIVDQVAVFTP